MRKVVHMCYNRYCSRGTAFAAAQSWDMNDVTLKESSYVYALNKHVPVRAHGHTGRFCVQVQWRAQLLCGWQAI